VEEYLNMDLLQNYYENRLTFGEVTDKSIVSCFLTNSVVSQNMATITKDSLHNIIMTSSATYWRQYTCKTLKGYMTLMSVTLRNYINETVT